VDIGTLWAEFAITLNWSVHGSKPGLVNPFTFAKYLQIVSDAWLTSWLNGQALPA
jgi:hypothetical protein